MVTNIFRKILSALSIGILILTLIPVITISEEITNWVQVKSNQYGQQWIDLNSLKRINHNQVKISSRFDSTKDGKWNQYLYVMNIDCEKKLYKAISENGIINSKQSWVAPNGDNLIEALMIKACTTNIT